MDISTTQLSFSSLNHHKYLIKQDNYGDSIKFNKIMYEILKYISKFIYFNDPDL